MNNIIVVFANSVKHGKHCVAGKDIVTKKWYRPVSSEDGAELSGEQIRYANKFGKYSVKPLQKIEMSFLRHVPLMHQPENYLISNNEWQQKYSINIQEVAQYLDNPVDLWGCGNSICAESILNSEIKIYNSLYLVQVKSSNLYITEENKRRISFTYNNIEYDLPVTDPNFDKIERCEQVYHNVLCVSLGERFTRTNRHYKIVASIL